MKKILLYILVSMLIVSCTSKWEYKVFTVKGVEQENLSKYKANIIDVDENLLNQYGKEGWELVDTYEKIETVHPNFGNNEYVIGLQPNVRTSEINFVFKRKK